MRISFNDLRAMSAAQRERTLARLIQEARRLTKLAEDRAALARWADDGGAPC